MSMLILQNFTMLPGRLDTGAMLAVASIGPFHHQLAQRSTFWYTCLISLIVRHFLLENIDISPCYFC